MKENAKKLLIIGDSYSTFEGYNPKGFSVYYNTTDSRGLDVRGVNQTWWHKLISAGGLELVHNNSWSGSTVCYTAYDGRDCSGDSSFIYRVRELIGDGFFKKNRIDTVIIFGGTNDSWAGSPMGEVKLSDFSEDDLYCAIPAVCYLIDLMKRTLPEARIIFVINERLNPALDAAIELASDHYGTEYLRLCGIDKKNGHPTIQGMDDIFRQVYEFIK